MNNYINYNINDHNIYNWIITEVISENEEYAYMITMNYSNINASE